MDPARWEGFGIHSAESAGDRTKELIKILDYLLWAPGAELPERLPPSFLIPALKNAAAETDKEADAETDPKKLKTLRDRAEAQRDMAAILEERAHALGLTEA